MSIGLNIGLTIVLGLFVCIVYGLLLGGREERLRQFFIRRKHGLVRRWYVRALVGAVRGRAAETDSLILGALVLILIMGLSSWSFLLAQRAQEQVHKSQESLKSIERMNGTGEPEPKENLGALEMEIRENEKTARWLATASRVQSALLFIAYLVGGFVWLPFVWVRRRATHELDRFAIRIQGLASKTELATIAVAELRVRDEASLRAYFAAARAVAQRHDVPGLVDAFDIWRDPTQAS